MEVEDNFPSQFSPVNWIDQFIVELEHIQPRSGQTSISSSAIDLAEYFEIFDSVVKPFSGPEIVQPSRGRLARFGEIDPVAQFSTTLSSSMLEVHCGVWGDVLTALTLLDTIGEADNMLREMVSATALEVAGFQSKADLRPDRASIGTPHGAGYLRGEVGVHNNVLLLNSLNCVHDVCAIFQFGSIGIQYWEASRQSN
jgi:hypothetical protein